MTELWPRPINPSEARRTQLSEAEKAADKRWTGGCLFVMRGGPHDGMQLRLWPHPYPDGTTNAGESGWNVVTFPDGSVYRRPSDVDPYAGRQARTKKGTNLPSMEFEETSAQLAIGMPASAPLA